jgi:hypothetical protein
MALRKKDGKNEFRLNEFILSGVLTPGITAGMTKDEISDKLNLPLDKPEIDTPDVDIFLVDLTGGIVVQLSFDKAQICYDISISTKYNEDTALFLEIDGVKMEVKEEIAFTDLTSIFERLNIDWTFNRKQTYLQTVCIDLGKGMHCYYSFGRKEDNDFGFFDIRCLLEGHKWMDV